MLLSKEKRKDIQEAAKGLALDTVLSVGSDTAAEMQKGNN